MVLHYCSSDDYSGTRVAGNLTFHGKEILTAAVQDLVSTFGIQRAESVVLAGSGAGARGVGHNCDYLAEAMAGVSGAAVRCLAWRLTTP